LAIVLLRVDERLIHGQVVIGWGHHLRPDRYIVVDDDLAESAWEQEFYVLGAGEAEVVFATVKSARGSLSEWRDDSQRSILLTRDVRSMRGLCRDGALTGEEVDLGGLHHGPGRDEVLPYLHLAPEDRDDLRAMADEGVQVIARDLPDAPRVRLANLLGE
jgi:PTS system mannose-specific IIB component/fructoselysine and glucoselysine-specific PTS system IIB component